jgi:Arc/MetJ family transcription regulator
MRHRGTNLLGGVLGFLAAAPTARALKSVYITITLVYTRYMTKRLVDIDEEALDAARSQLGTTTIKATVNEALRLVGSDRSEVVRNSLDVLSGMPLSDRDEAWR